VRKLTTFLLLAIAAGAAYFTFLFLVQRSMLFPAPRIGLTPEPLAGELVRVPHDDGEAVAIVMPPVPSAGIGTDSARSDPAPLMMFLHGNGEVADFWIHEFDVPRSWGWAVMLVEYPGYGRAPGSPTESSITAGVLALYDWAAADPRFDASRMVAYGRSLGGAAAARLAARRQVAALVLESTFTGVRPFARRFLAPGFLVRDPFDTLEALQDYDGPILVLHGRHDEIVPVDHARMIADAVSGARLVELPCGHNDCPRSWELIGEFLRER
jgi:fermentation-respiration switch protein FrsA (DUF1100 family)